MKEAWPVVSLGEVVRYRKHTIRIDDASIYKRCRVQLHAQGIVERDSVPGLEIKTKEQQVCQSGELLVAEIDAKVGGFGMVPDELDGAIVSSHYFLFGIEESRVDRRFLDFYLRTVSFRGQVLAQGSTNYAAIRPQDVLGYKIPLPPLSEQRRIVARIEALASLVDAAGGIQERSRALEARLAVSAARSAVGHIHAPITALEDWMDPAREGVQTGPFGVQLSRSDFRESGTTLLTIGNVQYGGLDLSHVLFVGSDKARDLQRYRIEAGDLLFARMGTVGRCCIVPVAARHALINYHIIRVALDLSRIEPRFVHWLIRASREIEDALTTNTRGATRKGVNSRIVRRLPLRVPSLPEQRRLVAYLDDLQAKVDALKTLQEKTAAELDALMPSILDKAFKGEL